MPSESGADSTVLNVLQITDCHLTKHADGRLLGVNTRDSLDAVLNLVEQHHPDPDCVLLTGDLAQDGSIEAYQHLKSRLKQFNCPTYWFAGNHDRRQAMQQVIGGGQELEQVIRIGAWQFVLLDSMVSGRVHGFLEDRELEILEQALQSGSTLHTLVALHHHPIEIGCAWLDKIGLQNRDQLFEIVDQYPNVKAMLWGHVHQQLETERQSVQLYATPSTCIQFLPKSRKFAVDNEAPGYRWLKLYPTGYIESAVHRAIDFEFELDMLSTGY